MFISGLLEISSNQRSAASRQISVHKPTLIAAGVTGLLVRPDDRDDLARLIARCLEDPATRARLVQAARALTIGDFSIERCAAAYGDLMREPVAPRCGRGDDRGAYRLTALARPSLNPQAVSLKSHLMSTSPGEEETP